MLLPVVTKPRANSETSNSVSGPGAMCNVRMRQRDSRSGATSVLVRGGAESGTDESLGKRSQRQPTQDLKQTIRRLDETKN